MTWELFFVLSLDVLADAVRILVCVRWMSELIRTSKVERWVLRTKTKTMI